MGLYCFSDTWNKNHRCVNGFLIGEERKEKEANEGLLQDPARVPSAQNRSWGGSGDPVYTRTDIK